MRSVSSPRAVSMITGLEPEVRSQRMIDRPSMPGSMRSRITRFGSEASMTARARPPSSASSAWKPSRSRYRTMTSRVVASSSTTSTVSVTFSRVATGRRNGGGAAPDRCRSPRLLAELDHGAHEALDDAQVGRGAAGDGGQDLPLAVEVAAVVRVVLGDRIAVVGELEPVDPPAPSVVARVAGRGRRHVERLDAEELVDRVKAAGRPAGARQVRRGADGPVQRPVDVERRAAHASRPGGGGGGRRAEQQHAGREHGDEGSAHGSSFHPSLARISPKLALMATRRTLWRPF